MKAIAATQSATKRSEIEAALKRGSMQAAEDAIAWAKLERLKTDLTPELREVLEKAALAAQKFLPREIDIAFDVTNPEAVAWLKVHAAELVNVNIIAGSKEAIRAIMIRAFEKGIPPRQAAELIMEHIGLLPRHAAAVDKYRTWLIEVKEQLVTDADRLSLQYARKLLRHRAVVIARNETMLASNRGQRALWQQAIDEGVLTEDEWLRVWIVTPDERLCQLCAPLADKTAEMNGQFPENGGDGPPRHIQCRCVLGLQRKRNLRAVA